MQLLPANFQGGATAAHLMLELWPSLLLVGWEIDEIVVTSHCHFLAFLLSRAYLYFDISHAIFLYLGP